jgi:hypothetical protein
MHNIEPFYGWKNLYEASEDERSPLYGEANNEYECRDAVYNYYIHPEWENFGSSTLYAKILFTDYTLGFCIIELMGEWNDCLYNDIMFLKRNIADVMNREGINKYILIGENVLNFHYSDDCYYEEWFDDVEEGWIALLNMRKHVLDEFGKINIDSYVAMGGSLNTMIWRPFSPKQVFESVDAMIVKRLNG